MERLNTTVQQVIDIPASHRIILDVPEEIPAGPVIITFAPAEQKPVHAKAEISPSYTPLEPHVGPPRRQSCRNMEEAIAASERRREAAKTDPSVYSLKPWHGILKNSRAWGKHVDVVAEIRKMRDEWPDYWGTDGDT
jgi:hypothetical protein